MKLQRHQLGLIHPSQLPFLPLLEELALTALNVDLEEVEAGNVKGLEEELHRNTGKRALHCLAGEQLREAKEREQSETLVIKAMHRGHVTASIEQRARDNH